MFESAVITRAGVDRQIDLGLLAETIFFYQSVQLVLNRGSISALATKIPIPDLIALLNRKELKLSYLHQGFGVLSSGRPRTHQFGAFTFAGTKEKKSPHYTDEIAIVLERLLGKSRESKKLIKTINDRVTLHRFKESPEKEKLIPDLARADISDANYLRQAVAAILKNLVPAIPLPASFRFEVIDTGQGYAVDTNLNFATLNDAYQRLVPPSQSSLTPEYLLAHIIDARLDTYFAAHYMAEIIISPVYSDLIQLKHFDFLKRRKESSNEIKIFSETALQDVPTLREIINARERTISEFLTLLDNARRFREWLQSTNADAGIIHDYYRSAVERTWADKLPTKTVRFLIASGVGVLADLAMPTGLGTMAGLGLGALDSLFLDKIIKGWRPNQFIDGPYRQFLSGDE